MLVQHIFELLFGIAVKSDELEPEAIISFPSDDGQSNDDQRPSTGRLDLEAQMGSDGKLDMAFDFASSKCQVHHFAMA
jgi:hypothetical protein